MIPLALVPYLGAAAVALAAGGWAWWKVDQAEDALADCQATQQSLRESLAVQTASVVVWSTAASAAQETSRQALAAASAVSAQRVPAIKRLEGLLLAAASKDCGPAVDEVRKGLQP